MASAVISGTITIPTASGGPDSSMIIGAPLITPSSTSAATLTFTEKSSNTYLVATGGPVTIPFGTIAIGNLLYLGTDQPLTFTFSGGAEIVTLAAGGFVMFYNAGITALIATATLLDATLDVLIAGA